MTFFKFRREHQTHRSSESQISERCPAWLTSLRPHHRRSYRKMALQFHPDKVTGSDAEKKAAAKKFAEINNAYEALSDPEKKRIYDQYGEEGLKQNSQGGGGGGGGQNIFDMFFGGGGGFGGFGGGQQEEQTPRGHDVYADLYVSLKDLYLGREIQVVRDKAVVKADKGKRQCKCKTVMKTRQLGPGMFQQVQEQKCEECPGVKLERVSETLNAVVEPGVQHGHHLTFFEEGEPRIDGDSGDLKLVIRQQYDPRLELCVALALALPLSHDPDPCDPTLSTLRQVGEAR